MTSALETEYQPRYLAYCRAKGIAPGSAWDGADYICWIRSKWREWEGETGRPWPHDDADHAAFDAWLRAAMPPPLHPAPQPPIELPERIECPRCKRPTRLERSWEALTCTVCGTRVV